MAYDEPHHRLLIVCRKPGSLLVMDSDTGNVVAQLPAVERSDDIAFDAEKDAFTSRAAKDLRPCSNRSPRTSISCWQR